MNRTRIDELQSRRSRRALDSAGSRLRHARVMLGYPREVFASALGIGPSELDAWENADVLQPDRLDDLASFGLDRRWLETGVGRPYRTE